MAAAAWRKAEESVAACGEMACGENEIGGNDWRSYGEISVAAAYSASGEM